MNLTKEQLQRAFLGLILVGVAIYAYFSMLLGPVNQREAGAIRGMAELEPKIREARSQLTRTRAIQSGDPHAERTAKIRELIAEKLPEQTAIVWLPQQISDLFRAHGIDNANVNFNGSLPDVELSGFVQSQWTITIPRAKYHNLAESIAALENHFGLGQIQRVEIGSTPANVEQQTATLFFSTVTRP